MDTYKTDLLTPFNPLDRNLNNNLISPSSLLDFVQAFERYFLGSVFQDLTIFILVIAFFISKRFRPLLLVNLTMYLTWYYFMLNHVRWALSAYLLSVSLAVIMLSEFIFYCRESRFTKTLNKKKSFLVTLILPLIFLLSFLLKGQILGYVSKVENQFRVFSIYVNSVYQNNLESYFNEIIPNYELMKYIDSVGYETVYTSGLGSLNQFNRLYSGNQKQIYIALAKDSYPTANFIYFKQLDSVSEPDLSKVLNKNSTQQLIFQTKHGASLWCVKVDQDTRFCR